MNELDRCKPWIKAALRYSGGTHSYEDVERGIIEGRMQLWPASKSCVVTEINQYPKKKVLHVFLAGGDLEEIKSMQPDVMEWGKSYGCTSMTMAGRKGWLGRIKDIGWKDQLVIMEKVIE